MIKKILLILFFIFLMFPVYFMFIGSLQDTQGIMKMPPDLLPTNITIENYQRIFALQDFLIWCFNSLCAVICTTLASVFISCSGGYVFAFYKFRFKKAFWALLLVGMMIPRISLIIPLYVIFQKLGLSGTMIAAMLPLVFSPVGLYLARSYFETVPYSFLESARLDGAHELKVLVSIVMPISKPIVTALAIFSTIGILQDYIWQSLVLQISERQTLLVGLMKFVMVRGGGELSLNPIGRSLAVGIILLFPLLVLFLIANKYFIADIGGVKE